MKQEEKELLLKDLCARLPYGVMIEMTSDGGMMEACYDMRLDAGLLVDLLQSEDDFKPYLRPMSSMTEEEKKEYELLANHCIVTSVGFIHLEASSLVDWLNKKKFDYRGLIPMGLALPASEGMYNI